jgi:hypothetical protein
MLTGKTIPLPGLYNPITVDYVLKWLMIGGIKFFRLSMLTSYLQKVKPFLTFDFRNTSLFPFQNIH